jgi:hypothetical protein
MPKFSYDPELKEIIDSILLENPEVKPGNAFGLPGYYINGKLFACVYESGLTLKLPKEKRDELVNNVDGFEPFKPLGKTMSQWVHMTKDNPEDYKNEQEIIKSSITYVRKLQDSQD